ncbi:CHAD domain-containing protein [Baekduia sp.]|jgi:CHAD domain-containing protein|uniref:CHAD domain-containing protein n=1 Tax=Baekduia sp. TaxID=2600305 RepID=UPI002DFA10B2|nr:CHAD domain-containing protein [Baekduia sp.]
MSYRLDLGVPVPDALRAVLVARLEHAQAALRDADPDTAAEAIHDARKDIKKARALLRLARPDLPDAAYRSENDALRDIARSLSATREADVLAETLELVATRLVGRMPELELDALRVRVAELAAAARPQETAGGGTISKQTAGALEQAVARARVLELDHCDTDTLVAGSVRAYARGADALAVAQDDTTVEHLHDWRKRAKDLWYHQRLLRDAWPELLKAQAGAADRLTKLLGDDHDLAQLAEHLPDEPIVLEAIAELRTEIQADAWELGRRVYAEKPKAFGRRLARYLASG